MGHSIATYFPEDMEHIVLNAGNLWSEIKNKKIFLTGGTGFLWQMVFRKFHIC